MSDNSLFGNLFATTASNVSSLHPKCKHRASLSNQFIPSLDVTSSDAAHPAHFKLPPLQDRENLQHFAAQAEGSQHPQEIKPVHPPLM